MKYVVLGASAAGINGAEMLRRLDKDAHITLISKDDKVYSRCILHHYICDERNVEQLNFVGKDFFKDNKITWIKGKSVTKVLDSENLVRLDDNREISYDKLLIATGSSSFIPPVENLREKDNVIGLRNLEDSEYIKNMAEDAKSIAIIGAGLVGMDSALGLIESKKCNAEIHLIDFADKLVSNQLDYRASKSYEKKLLEHGVKLHLGHKVKRVITNEENEYMAERLELEDGTIFDSDLIVVAAGVRSNIAFLEGSNVEYSKFGLVFNAKGETNIPNIYGAGDVSGIGPIWPVATKEGIIAASNMVGVEREMDDFFISKATLNFFNIPTMSLGEIYRPNSDFEEHGCTIEIEEDDKGNYKKIVHKDGKIRAAIIQGELFYGGVLTSLIKNKIDVSKVKKPIFEIDYSDFFVINDKTEFEI